MSSDDKALFSNFGKGFQEKVVQALLLDRQWASQFADVVKPEYFETAYLQKLVDKYLTYYRKYKDFPSLPLMIDIMKEEMKTGIDAVLRDQIIDCIKRISSNKDLGDLAYVKEKSLEYCRRRELKRALSKSLDLVEQSNYENVVDIVRKAINIGSDNTPGMDLSEDIEARYAVNMRKTIPTGIPEIDEKRILNGGLGMGELGIVVAPTGVGKSHMLVHFGSQAILRGKNVLHYTFELREAVVGIRYDSHLLGISSTDCPENKEKIAQFYKDNVSTLGRLRIKHYPTSSITCNQLRAHVERCKLEGFNPDMIIVDYAGIMRSSEKSDLLRLEMKRVCEELRGFADEMGFPVWTAIQSNKEGSEADVVDLSNMAESYGQAHVADFVLGLSRKSANKSTGIGNIFIAKNRAGMDGIQFTVQLDTARSKLRILTDQEVKDNDDVSKDAMQGVVRNAQWNAYKRTNGGGNGNPNPPTQHMGLKPSALNGLPLKKIEE
jgi:replicative DNA helicase